MADQPTILGLLIGLTLISAFAGIIVLSLDQWDSNYDVDNLNDVNISKYNQLDAMHSQSEQIKGDVSDIDQPTGILDVIGGFFYNAYKVLISIPQSFNLLYTMTNDAVDDADLGDGGSILKSMAMTIIIFIIFVGIILAVLLKRDKL